jgi:choice-of-anchor A domain-containing protein
MRSLPIAVLAFGLMSCVEIGRANAGSLGVASDYALIALTGDIDYSGPDITGRIAAAGDIQFTQPYGTNQNAVGIGDALPLTGTTADPYAIVAGGQISTTDGFHVAIDKGGNVISGTPSNSNLVWFNDGGSLKSGSFLLNTVTPTSFATLDASLDALSAQYAKLAATSIPMSSGNAIYLTGLDPKLNVFYITAAQFSVAANQQHLDILAPTTSTVIINVIGCNASPTACVLNSTPYINGNEETATNSGNILFNFPDAKELTVFCDQMTTKTNCQALDGAILAPYADLSGGGELGGTVMVASDDYSGQINYEPFDGTLPPGFPPVNVVPEPGSLGLLGIGILSLAGLLRFRMH